MSGRRGGSTVLSALEKDILEACKQVEGGRSDDELKECISSNPAPKVRMVA